jgi:hypothetical protein
MTRNPAYNELLERWRAQGCESHPECEDCGRDLSDQDVYDTGVSWVCADCLARNDQEPVMNDAALRQHEQRQMGIT